MKSLRDIRVIPVVLVAVLGLAVLKMAGLVLEGGYVFDYRPEATKPSWAQEDAEFSRRGPRSIRPTSRVRSRPKEPPKPAAPASEPPKPDGVVVYPEQTAAGLGLRARDPGTAAGAAAGTGDPRPRDRNPREPVEVGGEAHRGQGRGNEGHGSADLDRERQKNEADAARFKGIVTMYEGMKPKDAAKVFDRLEMAVLYEIASQIAPRKMSDILGLMQPEAAERLTVELARRAGNDKAGQTAELPKIEGKMLAPKAN